MKLPLKTERLLIRRMASEDAGFLYELRSDEDLCRYQGWHPESLEMVRGFAADQVELAPDTPGTWFQFIICLQDTGQAIGDCGVNYPTGETQHAEIGFTLTRDHHGHGYASEAATGLLTYLFDDLHKHRVVGTTDPRNFASIAVLERIGMRKEAHHVESLQMEGQWVDNMVFAILRREWDLRHNR